MIDEAAIVERKCGGVYKAFVGSFLDEGWHIDQKAEDDNFVYLMGDLPLDSMAIPKNGADYGHLHASYGVDEKNAEFLGVLKDGILDLFSRVTHHDAELGKVVDGVSHTIMAEVEPGLYVVHSYGFNKETYDFACAAYTSDTSFEVTSDLTSDIEVIRYMGYHTEEYSPDVTIENRTVGELKEIIDSGLRSLIPPKVM